MTYLLDSVILSVELGVSFNNQSSQMPSLFLTLHMAVNLRYGLTASFL